MSSHRGLGASLELAAKTIIRCDSNLLEYQSELSYYQIRFKHYLIDKIISKIFIN